MSKEWILNSAVNRFQLNFKRNVGATSEAIRKCQPKTLEEWEKYYFENVRSKEHIIELGQKLYIKITEVLTAEIESITEEDCINYILELVTKRTFDGYMTEIDTIYGKLRQILNQDISPAPDEWDRKYNVDFYIKIKNKFIGLQIKPVSDVQLPEIYKERVLQKNTHEEFTKKFGGKVFYIFSYKNGKSKEIANIEVIQDIQKEIIFLSE
ncbi:MAG: MjaI family restriction endonuclease [Candidatus Gastranaerophilaceae bacterium]